MGYFLNYRTSPVVRWPFKVVAGALTLEGGDNANPAVASKDTYDFIAAAYILEGTGTAVLTYNDFLPFLEAALENIHDTVHSPSTATYTVTLDGDGKLTISTDAVDDIYIYGTGLGGSATTFDISQLGFDDDTYIPSATAGDPQTSNFMAHYQWYSGLSGQWHKPEHERHLRYEKVLVGGKPIRQVHTDAPWYDAAVVWDLVPGARVVDSRAAQAAYASMAGIDTDEDMTFENLLRYLDITATTNYPIPGQIFLFDSADPASAVSSGPYHVKMEESGILMGFDEDPVEGFSAEMFPVKLSLARV